MQLHAPVAGPRYTKRQCESGSPIRYETLVSVRLDAASTFASSITPLSLMRLNLKTSCAMMTETLRSSHGACISYAYAAT